MQSVWRKIDPLEAYILLRKSLLLQLFHDINRNIVNELFLFYNLSVLVIPALFSLFIVVFVKHITMRDSLQMCL